MEELKIELKYNPQDFREIYYQNGQGSVFTYKPTQTAIIYFLSIVLFICIIYFVSYQRPYMSWLLVFALIILLITIIHGVIIITKYLRWKAATKNFIRELSRYKSFNIHLTSSAIEFTQDSKITIDKWDSIQSVSIFENYLMMFKGTELAYFIPEKSMKPDEFIKLKNFITLKIKEEATQ